MLRYDARWPGTRQTSPRSLPAPEPMPSDDDRTALAREVAAYLRRTGMARTTLSKLAVNDPTVVGLILRDDCIGVGPNRRARIRAWMAANPDGRP